MRLIGSGVCVRAFCEISVQEKREENWIEPEEKRW